MMAINYLEFHKKVPQLIQITRFELSRINRCGMLLEVKVTIRDKRWGSIAQIKHEWNHAVHFVRLIVRAK